MTQQTYTKKVAKKLACGKEKREEFTRQLASDIESALESGESWDAIQNRLGTPAEIAQEINESLGETALAYNRKKVRILGLVLGAAAVCLVSFLLLFTMSGQRTKKQPEQAQTTISPHAAQTKEPFSDDTLDVIDQLSLDIIEQFSAGNYKTILDQGDDKLKASLSIETLKQVKEQIMPDAGEFEGIKDSSVALIQEENIPYVTVQTQVLYANQTVTFTLFWNDQKELCGFYLK